jgi:hypothetical protein
MHRDNPYEAAFESYLLHRQVPFLAIDEAKRLSLGEETVKSMDFLVLGPGGARLCVDVKGRRFPGGPPARPRRVWECWVFAEDVEGLRAWSALAGDGYRGLFVFAYQLGDDVAFPAGALGLYSFRGRRYLFRAAEAAEYGRRMRPRSPSWKTVSLPTADYRAIVRPFDDFLHRRQPVEAPCRA